jgi:hypothetical protein
MIEILMNLIKMRRQGYDAPRPRARQNQSHSQPQSASRSEQVSDSKIAKARITFDFPKLLAVLIVNSKSPFEEKFQVLCDVLLRGKLELTRRDAFRFLETVFQTVCFYSVKLTRYDLEETLRKQQYLDNFKLILRMQDKCLEKMEMDTLAFIRDEVLGQFFAPIAQESSGEDSGTRSVGDFGKFLKGKGAGAGILTSHGIRS